MASVKRLKKDIDYLTSAVIFDCMNYAAADKEIEEIVENILVVNGDLKSRLNAGRRVAKNERKAYYNAIFKDLLKTVDSSFTRLSNKVKA